VKIIKLVVRGLFPEPGSDHCSTDHRSKKKLSSLVRHVIKIALTPTLESNKNCSDPDSGKSVKKTGLVIYPPGNPAEPERIVDYF
jgi:hypothetical protein